MDRKKQVLRLIHYTQNCVQEFTGTLSPADRERQGQVDHWSIKDHLAHLAHWKNIFNHRLQIRDTATQKITDVDKENARIFEMHRLKPWNEVWAMLIHADEELEHLIRMISEEDLVSTTLVPALSGRPLWQSVISDGVTHPICHLGYLYIDIGQPEAAVTIQERILEDLQSLDDSRHWRGNNIYNLACCYATSGLHDQAMQKLQESLQMNPDLREWSLHDTDLDSLRKREDYRSLYQGQPTA